MSATCDFPHDDPTDAADCHGGELYYCEAHRPVVLAASRSGVLDRPDYTIDDLIAAAGT